MSGAQESAGGRLAPRHGSDPEVLLVTGFGSGFLRPGPGTWGSLAALLIWWFVLAGLLWWVQIVVVIVTLLVSVWLVGRVGRRYGVHDDPGIVVDEFVGMWIALLAAPVSLPVALGAFALFRVLDIWKPGPIRLAERRAPGAWGVMLDDVVAGVLVAAVLQISLRSLA